MLVCLAVCPVFAAPPEGGGNMDETTAGIASVDNSTYIDANRILMFVTNHGNIGRDLEGVFGYDYGTFFPYTSTDAILNGTNTSSPLFCAGLWLGGRVNGEVRVAISEYSSEFVPGPMLNGTFQPDNPAFHVYKIYRDSLASNPNSGYWDYMQYAVPQGAPVDGVGEPLVHGDQTTWTVYNDADPTQHFNNAGETDPLGIEVKQSVWSSMGTGSGDIIIPKDFDVTHLGNSTAEVFASGTTLDVPEGDEFMLTVTFDPDSGPYWDLINVTTGSTVLENQTDTIVTTADGIQIVMSFGDIAGWEYVSADPPNLSPVAVSEQYYSGGRWFTGGQHGGDTFFGGVFMEPNFWGGTTVAPQDFKPVEIRFRPMQSYTDLNGDGMYTTGEPYEVDDLFQTQNAFMYTSFDGSFYEGFFPVPFTAWDISDTLNPRQLNVVVRDRDENQAWDLHIQHDPTQVDTAFLPNSGDLRYNYVWILDTDYDPSGFYYGDGTGGTVDFWSADGGISVHDAMWVLWLDDRYNGGMLAEEGSFRLFPNQFINSSETIVDTFTFTSSTPEVISSGLDATSAYIEYILYNKGQNTIDDFYVSFWADPDVGGAGDDLVGCDTLQDIFYAYNANNNDTQYPIPPATGFKILKGPLVPSPGDTAYFGDVLVPNYKNIGMVSFNKYINGTDPDNMTETYNYMLGLTKDGSPYMYNGQVLSYVCSGDPVTGTGDLDVAPSDRRLMASFGPFDFAPGDSQYVLIKMSIGLGSDRLSSISDMIEKLNIDPTDDPDDPYEMINILKPDTQLVIFKNAIEPVVDTIIIGRAGEDIEDIDPASILINGSLAPSSVDYLASHDGFGGRVLQVLFPATDFISGYGNVWDVQEMTYTVDGSFADGSPLAAGGTFWLRGHRSGDANADGVIDMGDPVWLINYIFRNGAPPDPMELGDASMDERVNIGDAIYLLNYIFRNGPPPGE